ncbi:MAG: hypothetical protein LBP43_02080, partial [Treponema sp.]|nr:hypothetical protein [Treponema sp.]
MPSFCAFFAFAVDFSSLFVIIHINGFSVYKVLGDCCASRVKPSKIGFQPIFYPANCISMPNNRDFYGFFEQKAIKIHKCNRLLAVCCASRVKPSKIGFQPIFYPANCISMPNNRDFYGFFEQKAIKIHKCNRLLDIYFKDRALVFVL